MRGSQLVARDPAMACLLGAVSGVDFGVDMGYDQPSTQNYFPQLQGQFNVGFGDDWGDDDDDDDFAYGYGFGAAAARAKALAKRPNRPPARPMGARPKAWNPSSTQARTLLLDPNRDSVVKVERYSFSLSPNANLVLGTASNLGTFTQNPSTSIKPQRVVSNAPAPGFVTLNTLQVANVNVFVGGAEDAYTYSAGAQNVVLDLPRLDPQNRATGSGAYSGYLPPGFVNGAAFQFILTFQGPATMAGGYGQ